MDPDVEFPVPNRREAEAIKRYLEIEREFIAATNFYDVHNNLQHRKHGMAVIAKIWERGTDAYIPYLALNYFDRFVSRNALPKWQGCSLKEQVCLVAICCVTLSYKMRTKQFSLHQFLQDQHVSFKPDEIMTQEFHILKALDWRMRSITPFYFLDYYYPKFKRIGGFKRLCINDLIVQCQGVHHLSTFKPSQIAQAAFLAATYIAHRSKMDSIDIPSELSNCWRQMVILCRLRNIDIHTESGTVFRSGDIVPPSQIQSEEAVESQVQKHSDHKNTKFRNVAFGKDNAAADTKARPQVQDRGKAVMVADTSEEEEEYVAPLIRRQRQDRDREVVEAGAKVATVETEAKQQVQDQGKTVVVADTSEKKDIEAETRLKEAKGKGVVVASEEVIAAGTEVNPQRQDKGKAVMVADTYEEKEVEAESGRKEDKGDVKASEEIVPAESEVNPQRQDKGKGKAVVVQEICEEAEIEYNRITRAKGKAKVGEEEENDVGKARFMSEITPAAEAAPKKLMNIKLKWPVLVEQGDSTQNECVRRLQTVRGTGQNPPLYTNWFNNRFNNNNCCTIL